MNCKYCGQTISHLEEVGELCRKCKDEKIKEHFETIDKQFERL